MSYWVTYAYTHIYCIDLHKTTELLTRAHQGSSSTWIPVWLGIGLYNCYLNSPLVRLQKDHLCCHWSSVLQQSESLSFLTSTLIQIIAYRVICFCMTNDFSSGNQDIRDSLNNLKIEAFKIKFISISIIQDQFSYTLKIGDIKRFHNWFC